MKLFFFENEVEMDLYVVPAKNRRAALKAMRENMGELDVKGNLIETCFRRKDWTITEYSLDGGPIRYAMCAGD